MKLAIQGQDYTAALDASHPLTIERKLNEPSICRLWLSLPSNNTLATPTRNQSLSVSGDDGTLYFTGYIAAAPLPEFAGLALEGPRYRIAMQAISDEILLDQLLMPPTASSSGETAASLLDNLVAHSGSSGLSTQSLTLAAPVNNFQPQPGAPFSKSAGQLAGQARAAYRALSGALSLTSIQTIVHPLDETDGSLTLANLSLNASSKRALANDITVCGELEPVAYVTEYFLGDGVTTQFFLSADPYIPSTSKRKIIVEPFNEPALNEALWCRSSLGGYISLGAGGLVLNGGSGVDGQTTLSWIDSVELGGTLLMEASGVTLAPGSTGILAGLFLGLNTQSSCVAGFQVIAQPGTGAVSIQPLAQGAPAGTSYAINSANQYTLRLRIHSPECERALSVYRSFGDNGAITCGGQSSTTPAKLQFEIQQFVNGVAGIPVTLYDGAISNLPATCTVIAASSLNLIGTMRAFNLNNLGSVWVVSTPPSGGAYTRRLGSAQESAECHVESTGRCAFYTGSVPVVGEQIAVTYRSTGRAVGRSVNTASQQALAQSGLPSTAAWIGTVTSPAPRGSADCLNAATAIQQASAGVSALWSGSYKASRTSFAADVWPGDALLLNAPSASLNAQVVVRTVMLSYSASCPDLFEYAIAFANDWADDLAIKTSCTIPADAWLPAAISPTPLANLTSLSATLGSGTVTIDAGTTLPSGGGIEIRRRDFAFMPGEDADLVARTSVPNIVIARQTANDRFYIRMYDAANPPNYSQFSAALFLNLPLTI